LILSTQKYRDGGNQKPGIEVKRHKDGKKKLGHALGQRSEDSPTGGNKVTEGVHVRPHHHRWSCLRTGMASRDGGARSGGRKKRGFT